VCGFIPYEFDGNGFKRSNYLIFKNILIGISTLIAPFKVYLSSLYEATDIEQLYIG
jgi:hypothetical protein